ncbi:unnamed protein product [Linum trigynum]|uniref:TFIIS N-terminal domain-containing protein n=1 Tax=Linum trigynum TaxID=586398 RepID=A0AAV2EXE4_9ROSI
MTLEDFFTLTEMKDGLTVPSRVRELIAVMQKEKDLVVKNIGDATRQWTAVGSTIAATENRDCLDLFIQLDGLRFVDRWLKEAQNQNRSTSVGFIVESITALLRAIEKLQIDKARSLSSGVWATINSLLDHPSSCVQDRARALFDSWKQDKDSRETKHDSQNSWGLDAAIVIHGDGNVTKKDIPVEGSDETKRCAAEPSSDEATQSRIVKYSEVDRDHQNQGMPCSKPVVTDAAVSDHGNQGDISVTDSVISNCNQDGTSFKEKTSVGNLEGAASTETRTSLVQSGLGTHPESDALNNPSNLCDASSIASASTKLESVMNSTTDDANIQEMNTDPSLQQKFEEATEGSKSHSASASDDDRTAVPALKGVADGGHTTNDIDPLTNTAISEDDQNGSRKSAVLRTTSNAEEDIGPDEDENVQSSDDDEELGDDYDFSTRSTLDTQSSFSTNRRKSNIDVEYGIVDALEVARLVAQEVEREVVDDREPSGTSSSEKIRGSPHNEQPGSPDSVSGKEDRAEAEDLPSSQKASPDSNEINKVENDINEKMESSQVTEAAREPKVVEKGFCGFDLNEEFSSDDAADHPADLVSAPISIVSISRPAAAAAASASPAAPLHFEGSLGWKGSAATSAFRPASPRKVDNNIETGAASSSNSKQRQGWLDIDLNISESADENAVDLMLGGRQISTSLSFQRGEESSFNIADPGKSERPTLDLNCLSDDGETNPQLNVRKEEGLFFLRNGHHRSPSPASSSSLRPSSRNFDLNDRPLFQNYSLDQGLYNGKSSHGLSINNGGVSRQGGDPVISIMGAKVEVGSRAEVGRRDFFLPQTPSMSMPNGKTLLEPAMDTSSVARLGFMGMVPTGAGSSYASTPPVFGYNPMSLSPAAMYVPPGGTIPYLVDSRGAPMVPHIMGSGSAVLPPYSQQPFLMNMTGGGPLSLNGAGPSSRASLDLNLGFPTDGGSSSSGGLRQFFATGGPTSSRTFEEHLRSNPQHSSSSSGMAMGKRKEPDGGWEPYSLHYKQPQPPWR